MTAVHNDNNKRGAGWHGVRTFPTAIELDCDPLVHIFRQVENVFLLRSFPLLRCTASPAGVAPVAPASASSATSAPPSAVRRTPASAAALVGSIGHLVICELIFYIYFLLLCALVLRMVWYVRVCTSGAVGWQCDIDNPTRFDSRRRSAFLGVCWYHVVLVIVSLALPCAGCWLRVRVKCEGVCCGDRDLTPFETLRGAREANGRTRTRAPLEEETKNMAVKGGNIRPGVGDRSKAWRGSGMFGYVSRRED